jgi:hypothetical protein
MSESGFEKRRLRMDQAGREKSVVVARSLR